MRKILWIVVGVGLIASGCRSTESVGRPTTSVVRHPVQTLVEGYAGHRIEFFDKDGKRVDELPRHQRGSISIYNNDETGQDNYTFNEEGVIIKHLRSYGEDFVPGAWQEVK